MGPCVDVSSQLFGASQEIVMAVRFFVVPDLLWPLFMPRLHSWRDESRSEAHDVVLYFAPP